MPSPAGIHENHKSDGKGRSLAFAKRCERSGRDPHTAVAMAKGRKRTISHLTEEPEKIHS